MFSLKEQLANEGTDLDGYDVAIPGIIAFILNFLVLLITSLTLTREYTYRTRTRLFTAPIRPADVVIGYAIALCLLSIMMSIVVLLVGTLGFGATVRGNWFLLLIAIILYGITFVFLGVFVSTQAKNELQAIQFAPLVALPSMALGGFLVPIESLPEILQPISSIIPLTYGIQMLRGIMLKGYGIADLWLEFSVIGIFCVTFLVLALITVKEEE
ncbi:MAG: ABC transporter permease [Promethearchaeota archaeon]